MIIHMSYCCDCCFALTLCSRCENTSATRTHVPDSLSITQQSNMSMSVIKYNSQLNWQYATSIAVVFTGRHVQHSH